MWGLATIWEVCTLQRETATGFFPAVQSVLFSATCCRNEDYHVVKNPRAEKFTTNGTIIVFRYIETTRAVGIVRNRREKRVTSYFWYYLFIIARKMRVRNE